MKLSRRILVVLGCAHMAAGLVLPFLPEAGHADVLLNGGLSCATIAAIYMWCRQESLERGTLPPGRSAVWAALLSPVFMPVYFFRTRAMGPAFKLSAKAYGYYLGISVLLLAAAALVSLGRG